MTPTTIICTTQGNTRSSAAYRRAEPRKGPRHIFSMEPTAALGQLNRGLRLNPPTTTLPPLAKPKMAESGSHGQEIEGYPAKYSTGRHTMGTAGPIVCRPVE